jgi:hypothetical protein
MVNASIQCGIPGCGVLVPSELKSDGCCVSHFLLAADRACNEMRREAASGQSSATRLAELEGYAAAAAMKLALIGTGGVRLSDDIKKRVLTTFLSLMILHESLVDRPANLYVPRRATRPEGAALTAAANF